jgi:hypothetical protein
MAKKFGLIMSLEEDKKNPKIKYQLFEAGMGFECARVLIPLDQAEAFEAEALAKQPKSKVSLGKLAAKFGGRVDGK